MLSRSFCAPSGVLVRVARFTVTGLDIGGPSASSGAK